MIIFLTSSTVAGVKEASTEFIAESPLVQDLNMIWKSRPDQTDFILEMTGERAT